MSYQLLVSDEAYFDIEEALLYYTHLPSEKLEDRFLQQLNAGFDYIADFPLHLSVKYKEMRVYNLKGFPYQVHFMFVGSQVLVFGVFHEKSNPKSWEERL
jgi:plasmid stabilization system protein ParE